MPTTIKVFVDASVLFAAVYSSHVSAYDLIQAANRGSVKLFVNSIILDETQRNLLRKAPRTIVIFQLLIDTTILELVPEPTKKALVDAAKYTALKDAAVIASAIAAKVDYLVTYDRKHLIDPPHVAQQSGLKIVTPDVIVADLRRSDK